MSDNEGSVPTEGIDYGDTMVVWPSTGRIPGGDVKPGGSSGLAPSMPPGWGDYAYFHERRSLNNFHRDRVITFEQIAE